MCARVWQRYELAGGNFGIKTDKRARHKQKYPLGPECLFVSIDLKLGRLDAGSEKHCHYHLDTSWKNIRLDHAIYSALDVLRNQDSS